MLDSIASLSTEWILGIAFILTFVRLLLYGARKQIGTRADASVGEWIESILFAWVAVFLFFRPFFFDPFKIPSESMVPTLKVGDRIVVARFWYRLHPPQRGDVVVFKSPPEAGEHEADFVKRLVGLPGDTIDLREGDVYINGRRINEPYTDEPDSTLTMPGGAALRFPYRVPPGKYVMFGDNRKNSYDSRGWGPIDAVRMKGKAVLKFWPPSAFRILH